MTTSPGSMVRTPPESTGTLPPELAITAEKAPHGVSSPQHPPIVTGIVRTIKHDMIAGKMGELPTSELHSVENKLREILAL